MNDISKWIMGVLVGIILAGGGWNESKQWQTTDEHGKAISDIRTDLAVIKEAAITGKDTSKQNNEKLDKTLRKLDAIIDRQRP